MVGFDWKHLDKVQHLYLGCVSKCILFTCCMKWEEHMLLKRLLYSLIDTCALDF